MIPVERKGGANEFLYPVFCPPLPFSLKCRVLDLMEQVSSRVSGSPELWYQFSRLRGALGSPLEAIDCLLKRHRALQQPGWEHDEGRCQLVCENLVDYCQSIVALSSSPSPDSPSQGAELPVKTADKKKLLMQAKLTVGGILKRLEVIPRRSPLLLCPAIPVLWSPRVRNPPLKAFPTLPLRRPCFPTRSGTRRCDPVPKNCKT